MATDNVTATMDTDNWDLMEFEVPPAGMLTLAQRHGAACVWCADPIPGGVAIDLGGMGGFRPHSCTNCRTARLAALKTYFDWAAHCSSCRACADGRRCATADHMQRAHMAARRQAGKDAVGCLDCGHEVSWAHRCTPNIWAGESAIHLGCSHAGSCERPAAQSAVT